MSAMPGCAVLVVLALCGAVVADGLAADTRDHALQSSPSKLLPLSPEAKDGQGIPQKNSNYQKFLRGFAKKAEAARLGIAHHYRGVKRSLARRFSRQHRLSIHEWALKVRAAKSNDYSSSKAAVFIFPSFAGSKLYLNQKPDAYVKKHCKLKEHGIIWLSTRFSLQSVVPGVFKPLQNNLRTCYKKVMSLQPRILSKEERRPAAPPVEYKELYEVEPNFGNVQDVKGLAGPVLGSVVDAADTYDNAIKALRTLGLSDEDIHPCQYDWRRNPNVETAEFQRYAANVAARMAAVPKGKRIVVSTFSLGQVVFHEVLRYLGRKHPELLGRISSAMHWVGAEGGAVQSAGSMLLGDATIGRLLGKPNEETFRMLHSWGAWAALLPSKSVKRNWLHVHSKAAGKDQVEHYNGGDLVSFFAKHYPDSEGLQAVGAMMEYQWQNYDQRLAELKSLYSKIQSAHCVDSKGVPTARDIQLTKDKDGKISGKIDYTLDGDGTVPRESQNLCVQLAVQTKQPSFHTTYFPAAPEVEGIIRKSAKKLFSRAKKPVMPTVLISKLLESHGNLGRMLDDATRLLALDAVGLPEDGVVLEGSASGKKTATLTKPELSAQANEVDSLLKQLQGAYQGVALESAPSEDGDEQQQESQPVVPRQSNAVKDQVQALLKK